MISYPFMSQAQPRNPPRVLSVQQDEEFVEADMFQQPMVVAAPNEADIDQHHLWHIVVIFFGFFCLLLCLVFDY